MQVLTTYQTKKAKVDWIHHLLKRQTQQCSSSLMELYHIMMCCLFNSGSGNTCLSDTCDSAIFLSNLMKELTRSPKQININVCIDNQSLFESLKTTKQTLDFYLRVEVPALGETCIYNKISNS